MKKEDIYTSAGDSDLYLAGKKKRIETCTDPEQKNRQKHALKENVKNWAQRPHNDRTMAPRPKSLPPSIFLYKQVARASQSCDQEFNVALRKKNRNIFPLIFP